MQPKEPMRSVRAAHPEASGQDVVRAAFHSVIARAGDLAEAPERKERKARRDKSSKA